MSYRFSILIMVLSLLLVSCEEKGEPSYIMAPAVKISIENIGWDRVNARITSINAIKTFYICDVPEKVRKLSASDIISSGTEISSPAVTVTGLEPQTEYHILCAASGKEGKISRIARDTIYTAAAPYVPDDSETPELPPDTPDIPDAPVTPSGKEFADMAICYGGHMSRNPAIWTKERFEKTVTYIDENGKEHWFFESMVMMELWDDGGNVTYSIANDGKNSSTKEHWQRMIDYWFDDTYGFKALDDCIDEVIGRIGNPPVRRKVVFFLPDAVYFKNYSKGVKDIDPTTEYWGTIDGNKMDFARLDHRLKAYRWYIDEICERFAQAGYKHIDLMGFYILSETLTMNGGWNYQYKQHEDLIPEIADYCHRYDKGLYWIPYCVNNSLPEHNQGLRNWKNLGIDMTVMQPNYYWLNPPQPWSKVCSFILENNMGMELEFEGTHGEYLNSSILSRRSDGRINTYAQQNKSRFREYFTNAKESGIYGTRPLVLYSGTNALYELAVSTDPEDRKLYHELGEFIINSPLKQ